MPHQQRDVFIAHELEGWTFKDMAAESGVAINTLLARKRYVHKATIAVSVADAGRGEVRYIGEIANTPEAIEKLVRQLRKGEAHLSFCYEAGPCGHVMLNGRKSMDGALVCRASIHIVF